MNERYGVWTVHPFDYWEQILLEYEIDNCTARAKKNIDKEDIGSYKPREIELRQYRKTKDTKGIGKRS